MNAMVSNVTNLCECHNFNDALMNAMVTNVTKILNLSVCKHSLLYMLQAKVGASRSATLRFDTVGERQENE